MSDNKLAEALREFAANQQPLPADMVKIIVDNWWDLIDDEHAAHDAAQQSAPVAVPQWQQCGETCKRAKLCATCAREIAPAPEAEGLSDERIDAITGKTRDELLDFIYEHGTASEGVMARVRKLARAVAAEVRAEDARDAARMDWLEGDGTAQVFKIGSTWYCRDGYGKPHRRAESLRTAIDAAMTTKEEGK